MRRAGDEKEWRGVLGLNPVIHQEKTGVPVLEEAGHERRIWEAVGKRMQKTLNVCSFLFYAIDSVPNHQVVEERLQWQCGGMIKGQGDGSRAAG